MMKHFEAISALAGSGKTYALTSRFIGLLARGAKPEEILAVTFTRKAAGEIFDRIVKRLAEAALQKKHFDELSAALKDYDYVLQPDDPARWLQQVLEAMPHLHIGTIDSLFVSIVRAFALELGLPPRQEILDGIGKELAREEALHDAMEEARRDPDAQQAFMEAFRRVTFAKQKTVRDTILETAGDAHQLFLYYPDPEAWGRFETIWPKEPWWASAKDMSHSDLDAEIEAFRQSGHFRGISRSDSRAAWEKFFDLLRREEWSELSDLTLFGNLVAVLPDLKKGHAEYKCHRTYPVAGEDAKRILKFLAYMVCRFVSDNLRKTAGSYRLMEAYEKAYRETVRAGGRLSFDDVQVVLFEAERNGVKMEIDYRLDGRFRHWMLDEFQDTSARQWAVLGNLADEILQGGQDRSFFYVGDVKQAIYGWRGGDARLFDSVHQYYKGLFGEKSILDRSWRSSPVVLKAVNQTFGEALDGPLDAHPEVLARWRQSWEEHKPAEKNLKLPGRVELLEARGDNVDDPVVGKSCDIAEMLHRQKGVTVAVLVRMNKYGDQIAAALRGRGIEVRREVNPRLCDNGVVSGLLSLLEYADHPGDGFALWHAEKCGLLDVLRRQWKEDAGIPALLRRKAAQSGVAGLLCDVTEVCREAGLLQETFIEMRLRQLLAAARDFDFSGRGGPSDFAARARTLEVKDPVVSGAVTVMTIHKAKGLEFDAVILPDLHGALVEHKTNQLEPFSTVDKGVGDPALLASNKGWVFPMPKRDIVRLDETFGIFQRAVADRKMYDEICLLYVAMTRARQGLYMITETPPKKATTLRTDAVLRQALAGEGAEPGADGLLYADGDPDWFSRKKAEPVPEKGKTVAFRPDFKAASESGRRLMVTAPSREEGRTGLKVTTLFDRGGREGAVRGIALHELFEQVEWYEAGMGERILEAWMSRSGMISDDLRKEIGEEFLRALKAPEIADALSRPEGDVELWREQGFELADEGRWITGRMDRVVVTRDEKGIATGATVLDFKSDRVSAGPELEERVDKYRPQVQWYIRAVSRLLNLSPDKISAQLVFTCPAYVREVK